jgi:hypothetical protein
VRNVVLDTCTAGFAERTAAVACEVLSQGPASAVSCVGVGSGSMRWSEEELQRLEVGVVGAFARGCHDSGIAQFCLLSAVGSKARSRFRYARVMGMKKDNVRNVGFARLAIFRPASLSATLIPRPGSVGWETSCQDRLAISISEFSVAPSPQRSLCTVERPEKSPQKCRNGKTHCAVQ